MKQIQMTYATLMLSFFRLQDKATHLLNIDGDLCHKVHNAVKVFCKIFDKYLEDLWQGIHNEIKYSTDIKTVLSDFGLLLGLHYNKWWLSVYMTIATNLPM